VKLGAQFLPEDFETCIASVVAAEQAGFAIAWFIDSQVLWQDCYVYMAHALRETERIIVGTAVSNPLTRHLTVTASVNATLNELHPGRVILGLGRGDSAVRPMGLKPVPTQAVRDAIPVLRDLMGGRTARMHDTDVHFRWHKQGPEVPIAVAATGPKNLRAGGALADIVMLYVGTHPDSVEWAVRQVREGAKEAGRSADDVLISMLVGMEVNDDLEAARAAVRWAPAACANHISDTMKRNPEHGMPASLTRLVEARTQMYDYYGGHLDSTADHTEYLTGDLIDDFTVNGPAETCLAKLRQLDALGVWEVSSAYYNGRFEQLERVGREIVPSLPGPSA
jgi:alkanesulfonate monooxygenase SsuD/methylene tetrahydromethanopterin reductase-like flavin-dependent oxidoreductase (luciferase family)